MNISFRYTLFALFYLMLLVFSGCSGNGNGTWTGPRTGFAYPEPADYSDLTWTDAFKAAHDKFSREYAFGDWKSVDWFSLYIRFLPRIEAAQNAHDEKAYYLALHEYVCSIPDGHISLSPANAAIPAALARERAGGGFGMAVAELDDQRVIVAAVIKGGPADLSGIVAGAEILTWGGNPVKTAIGQIDVGSVPYKTLTGAIGGESPLATTDHYRLEQARLLTRGAVGAVVQVMFKNPDAAVFRTATLTAVDDAGQTFSLLNFAKRPAFSDQVDYRILPEGYGYILIRMENSLESSGYPSKMFLKVQEAIASFVAGGVPGIIVDLRGNYGGSDILAADLCGFFYITSSFYEYQEYYDKRDGQFFRITFDDSDKIIDNISINPMTPYFNGPVVALVNPGTISSGEGPAMGIARLNQGSVIGFHGTNGSFGMVGGSIKMPGGYTISYPFGRSIDINGMVQLDSRNGRGGVSPTLRVPKTIENVLAYAAGTDAELQYAIGYLRKH